MKAIWGAASVAILALSAAHPAQSQVDAPSAYERAIETPGADGGARTESDAAAAQGAALEGGQDVIGLSSSGKSRVEEIVVTARRRQEMLEDTPIAVTAISAEGLRESNITRIDQIEQLGNEIHVLG